MFDIRLTFAQSAVDRPGCSSLRGVGRCASLHWSSNRMNVRVIIGGSGTVASLCTPLVHIISVRNFNLTDFTNATHLITSSVLYQPYPSSWPEFTPRDKFASWLDAYAVDQNIIIWTKSTLVGEPQYDPVRKAWDVVVNRDGVPVELHPAHIVLATGVLGDPHVPIFHGKEMFDGTVIHSSQFADARPFVGKDVVVIGAGNSSIDICQDLALGGVRSVTMVQRSSSAVMSRKCGKEDLETIFLPDQPAEVGDVKWAAIPLGFRRETMINSQEEQWSREKELSDKLRRAGLKLNLGEDGEGVLLLIFERAGGKFKIILRWSPS